MANTMDDMVTRYIPFAWNGQTYFLSTTQKIEVRKDYLQVRFIFEPNDSGIEYVIGENSDGFLRLVDSNEVTHHLNPLYQQILPWFEALELGWLHVKD
jgi:hypothetical protein